MLNKVIFWNTDIINFAQYGVEYHISQDLEPDLVRARWLARTS